MHTQLTQHARAQTQVRKEGGEGRLNPTSSVSSAVKQIFKLAAIGFHLAHSPVRFIGILWSFQLHLEALGANLEAIHRLDCALCRQSVVVAHKPKTFAEACHFIDKDLRTDDIAKRCKHLNEVRVGDIIWEMIDE